MYRVLIVEDEVIVRAWLKKQINWASCGFTVVAEAANGREALEIFNNELIDLILTDIRMPVMDGITLLRHVREKDHRIQFLILTCLDEFSLIKQAMELDVTNYILKLTSEPDEIERELLRVHNKLLQIDGRIESAKQIVSDNLCNDSAVHKNQRLAAAQHYLETHFAEDISLTQVADVVGVTPNYLGRIYLQHRGCSFTDELNKLRVEKAKQMLDNPVFRVYEVAQETGFINTTYFFRVFKKYEGCTPSEYRERKK